MNEPAGLAPSRPISSRVPAARSRGAVFFFRRLGSAALSLLVGCGGVQIPPEYVELAVCLASCPGDCYKVEGGYVCKPGPDPCEECPPGWVCVDDECVVPPPPDPCEACSEDQECVDGECVPRPDPCASCAEDERCVDGRCVPQPEPACPFDMPTARQLVAQGRKVLIRPDPKGKRSFDITVWGEFGREHYRQPGLWPEAAAAGRTKGPAIPDGHPYKVACDQAVLELDGPYVTLDSPAHMSVDPFIVIDDLNQNHPNNVKWGCGTEGKGHASWVKEPHGGHQYVVAGQMVWFTAHATRGKPAKVCAEAKGGAGKTCVDFEEPR